MTVSSKELLEFKSTQVPINERMRVLMLSDDIRVHTGVANITRELIKQTSNIFNWGQIAGGCQNHQEAGTMLDVSQEFGKDASVTLFPVPDYGNAQFLRNVIAQFNPNVIVHFTDPRYWDWLYAMAPEFRSQGIPLAYLNIWDSMPTPWWNTTSYESCDLLMAISAQTYGINHRILSQFPDRNDVIAVNGEHPAIESIPEYPDSNPQPQHSYKKLGGSPEQRFISYLPHGVDTDIFKPLPDNHPRIKQLKARFKLTGNEFVVLAVGQNISRKSFPTIIMAFKKFQETTKSDAVLILHTQPATIHGTDLEAVCVSLAPNQRVIFSHMGEQPDTMAALYNIADVTVNASSSEGWGVPVTESHACGTMTIVNVTGGLQDQVGFAVDGRLLDENDYVKIGSLHRTSNGVEIVGHSRPVWPSNSSIFGSPLTPYLYDDRVDESDLAWTIQKVYELSDDQRKEFGELARKYVTEITSQNSLAMGFGFANSIFTLMGNYTNPDKASLYVAL